MYPYFGATGQVGFIDGYLFEGESVLLGEDGAPFLDSNKSKAYLVDGKYWLNNHAHILRGLRGLLTNRYLSHFLNSFDYRGYITGTTRAKLTQNDLRRMEILLPPFPEQERIASKVDELFSELDAGVASLKRARALLKKYRQAVLKAAVTGELTRDWRARHEGQIKESGAELLERHQGQIKESGADLLERILKARRQTWEAAEVKKLRAKGKPPKDDRWKQKYKHPQPPDTPGLPALPEGWVGRRWISFPGMPATARRASATTHLVVCLCFEFRMCETVILAFRISKTHLMNSTSTLTNTLGKEIC